MALAKRGPERPRAGARWAAALAAAFLVPAVACSSFRLGDELVARHPRVASIEGQRLGTIHPFVLPADGRVTFFLCRWPTDAPLPVSIPLDTTPDERALIDAALGAWQQAGLGVRFLPLDGDGGRIEIALEDEPVATPSGPDTANAVVDCRIAPLRDQRPGADPVLGAMLDSARLRISRVHAMSWQGRVAALSPAELAGTLLHELGHALGFQGHASGGDTVMLTEVERVRRAGRELLAGERFDDPTLRALYAVPSGSVIASVPVERWQTDLVDRMARLAEHEGLDGPFTRVGESAARIFWRDARGREYGLLVPELRKLMRDPRSLRVIPEPLVRRALPRSRDLGPGDG